MRVNSRQGGVIFRVGILAACFLNGVALFAQADWTQKFPAHVPPKRINSAMAQYGSGGAVVMFGGLNLGATGDFSQHNVLCDTWVWNGSDWTQVFRTVFLSCPAARYGAAMAYVAASGKAVMFGGTDASGHFLGDTWTFFIVCTSKSNCGSLVWAQVSSASNPSARSGASMAYDAARSRIVLTGGAHSSGALSDNWEFDPAANSWLSQPGLPPPAANQGAMAPCSGLAMEFGGPPFGSDDTAYVYPGHFVEGIGDVWNRYTPATRPLYRWANGMAFYPVSGQDVLYGGESFLGEVGVLVDSDTWNGNCANSTVTWSQQSPAHSPGPRWGHAMTTGPSGLTLLLFGGSDVFPTSSLPNGRDHNDTWVWGRRVACLPGDGSQIAEGSKVTCEFTLADGIRFGGWHANGFDPEFRHKVSVTFTADDDGPASITAQWTDAAGLHSQTFNYTVVEQED